MVCGGLPASSLVSLPMSQILVVICDVWWFWFFFGGLWWFAVICGGLSFSHVPILKHMIHTVYFKV